MKLRQI